MWGFYGGFTSSAAAQQLQAMDGTARIVVIHPNYAKQHLVLQTLLEHKSAVYVRFVA
jgi:hypothetical protein